MGLVRLVRAQRGQLSARTAHLSTPRRRCNCRHRRRPGPEEYVFCTSMLPPS